MPKITPTLSRAHCTQSHIGTCFSCRATQELSNYENLMLISHEVTAVFPRTLFVILEKLIFLKVCADLILAELHAITISTCFSCRATQGLSNDVNIYKVTIILAKALWIFVNDWFLPKFAPILYHQHSRNSTHAYIYFLEQVKSSCSP